MFDIIIATRGVILESSLHQVNGVYTFTMMLSSVTVIDVANRKGIFCVARYQLIYGPAPVRRPEVRDHCSEG